MGDWVSLCYSFKCDVFIPFLTLTSAFAAAHCKSNFILVN